jgi:3-dehydroquinate synthetase
MPADPEAPVDAGSPGPDLECALRATGEALFRLEVVPDLFNLDNRTLADALTGARRLLVVRDPVSGERAEALLRHLRAVQQKGLLDDFHTTDIAQGATGGIADCDAVVDAAMKAQLGRRDTFVAFGGERTSQTVAMAAASFRRHTAAVRIHRDLASVVAGVRDGTRVRLRDSAVGALVRRTHLIVDEDGLSAPRPIGVNEHTALLTLAMLDPWLLDGLDPAGDLDGAGRAGIWVDALGAVVRLCRQLGPGHPAWSIGETWAPLAPQGISGTRARVWSLVVAASVAYRLGVLPSATQRRMFTLIDDLYPGLRAAAALDADLVRLLVAGVGPDPDRPVTLALPGRRGGELVTVGLASLERALAGAGTAHPAAGARLHQGGARMSVTTGVRVAVPAGFPVRLVRRVLEPDGVELTALLPPACRVLAVVDPYRRGQVEQVDRLLTRHARAGRVSRFAVLGLAATERTKTITQVARVIRAAERLGLGDQDRIVVVGGGIVMDIVGYAAYLYHGDSPYIRIPTTLVGMIDAGVGLKVGVNVDDHKNVLGAYHPPLACLCDTGFLRTLGRPELRCGLAEAIKIAVVCDARLFALIERHYRDVLVARNTPEVREILQRSIRAMLRQLSANPFEEDLRRLPDFGHEFGHALESMSGYRLRHGEAVAIGMALSCCLATGAGYLPRADLCRILTLLRRSGLPCYDARYGPEALWRRLHDEVVPHKAGRLHLAVPRRIGVGDFIDSIDDLSPDMVRAACDELRGFAPDGMP